MYVCTYVYIVYVIEGSKLSEENKQGADPRQNHVHQVHVYICMRVCVYEVDSGTSFHA